MHNRLLALGLLLTSLIGYLEWGKDNHAFLFQTEIEVLSKIFIEPSSIVHPLVFTSLA